MNTRSKRMMRFIRIAILVISITISSCKKHEVLLRNEGIITGIDLRACPCTVSCPCVCGGLIFHFTDTGDSSRVILDNATLLDLPLDTRYPVKLTLDWQNTTRCDIKAIKILSYKLQ